MRLSTALALLGLAAPMPAAAEAPLDPPPASNAPVDIRPPAAELSPDSPADADPPARIEAPDPLVAPVPPAPVGPPPGALRGPRPADPLKRGIAELRKGPLLIHGNYCGIGARPGSPPPIDPLDAACMRHDSCTKTGKLPSCACDARLQREASVVAQDPRTPPDIAALAATTAAGMAVLICK